MGIKKWKFKEIDKEKSAQIAKELGVSRLLCDTLFARGFNSSESIEDFIHSSGTLTDPYDITDMDKAVDRVSAAIMAGEQIVVYGDYDCDGVTSTVLLSTYLQEVGANAFYYIPDRHKEGYGLNERAIKKLSEKGIKLIITVDNGISAIDQIDYANELGVDVVVTDHHKPRAKLPNAIAVVNPHREGDTSTCKNLSGVGVVFKLICAIEHDVGYDMLEIYSDIVCIGTIADIVDVRGENRTFIKHGLKKIEKTDNVGIRALFDIAGLKRENITSSMIAFGIVPRVNAAGRLGCVDKAMQLFLTDEQSIADSLAKEIDEMNTQRKELENGIVRDIMVKIDKEPSIIYEPVILLTGENWHHGVIGIVAAKMIEKFGKPCMLFSVNENEMRGSGRSVEGFSIIDALFACDSCLKYYGGHPLAAGASIDKEKYHEFAQMFLDYAKQNYNVMPKLQLNIDCEINPDSLNLETIKTLSSLEPFGTNNEIPLFAMKDVKVAGVYSLSENKHIRLKLEYKKVTFFAVYFGMSTERFPYQVGDNVEIAANIDINTYNNEERISIKIREIRLLGVKEDNLLSGESYYDKYKLGEKLPQSFVPTRDDIAVVYKYIKTTGTFSYDYDVLFTRLQEKCSDFCKVRLCIDILEELGLVMNDLGKISIIPVSGKVDLTKSLILHSLLC